MKIERRRQGIRVTSRGRRYEAYLAWDCLMIGVNWDWYHRAIYLHAGPIIIGTWAWRVL